MTRKLTNVSIGPSQTIDAITARVDPKRADSPYLTTAWRSFVAKVIRQRGRRCEACGASGCRIFGDHITELKDGGALLDASNVQLLCGSCHTAKTIRARNRRFRSRPGHSDQG